MKTKILLGALSAIVVGCFAFLLAPQHVPGEFLLEKPSKEKSNGLRKAQRAKEAMEARFDKLKDENGNFSTSYYYNALKQANQFKMLGSRSGSLNLQWEELGPDNIGGRTRAILIDKRDPSNNTVYAGGVGGGMWKSTDGANTWQRLTNWNNWLTVSCIAQGPAPNYTIYIGTGEGLAQVGGSSFNSGNMGNGIFKLDANDSHVLITPDGFSPNNTMNTSDVWAVVNRIAVNPNDGNQIIAATGKGLYQSSDAGTTWDPITIPGVANGQSAADVDWASDGVNIFASVGGNNKLAASLNGGFSWQRISNTTSPGFPGTQGRLEVAVAPSDPNILYISVATTTGATYGTYRSADAGATWTTIGLKGPLFNPFGDNNQGWYDNVIAVSPADPNKVYLGGVNFYTWSDQSGWKEADAGLGGGQVNPHYIHPDKHAITIAENNPEIMYVGNDGGVYKSVNAVSAFPFPSFSVKNRGYNVTQHYSVGAGLAGDVLGGTQDNGTPYIDYHGNTRMAAEQVTGGDGTYAEISHLDPRIMFSGVYFGSNYRSGNGGSSFGGFYDLKIDPNSFNQPSRCSGQEDNSAQFISPFWLAETKNAANGLKTVPYAADRDYTAGEVITVQSKTAKYPFQYTLPSALSTGDSLYIPDPVRSRFFTHSICGLWVTPDALDLGIIPRWFRVLNNMSGWPVSVSASSDGDVLYVGTTGGRVYRFGNFNARCDTATYLPGSALNTVTNLYTNSIQYRNVQVTSRSIEGICVNPNNSNHVVAVSAGFSATTPGAAHVFESIDGGQTWTPLVTGLPNMPVYDVVVHDDNTIIIGTELGIWSWDGSQWNEENDAFTQPGSAGMQRVPVYRLMEKPLYNDNCRVIYAGTHGRGMWRCTTLTTGGCELTPGITGMNDAKNNVQIFDLNIFPNPISLDSRVSITLDKSTDITFRVFDMTGRLYKEITHRNTKAGENVFALDASGLASGTYLLAATVGNTKTQSRLFTISR